MATIRKRGDSWQAQIRIKGYPPQSKSFPLKSMAEAWAKKEETKINCAEAGIASLQPTVRAIIEKFRDDVMPNRKGEKWESVRVERFLAEKWVDTPCDRFDPQYLRDWIEERKKSVQNSSIRRELSLLAGIFKVAIKEGWIKIPISPTKIVSWPEDGKARTRTVSEDELTKVVGPLPDHATRSKKDYLAYAAWFGLETGLRAGEICQLTWDDIDVENLTVRVIDDWSPDNKQGKSVKNGESREVPLSPRAIQIINVLSSHNEEKPMESRVFGMTTGVLDQYWRKAVTDAGFKVGDIVFHDLRRTALTKMARFYDVKELSKISGHRDVNVLVNVYYQPSAKDLAQRMRQLPQAVSPAVAA